MQSRAETENFEKLLSILSEREELIIQARYGLGWSLRKVSRAIGVDHSLILRQHERALQAIRQNGGDIIGDDEG